MVAWSSTALRSCILIHWRSAGLLTKLNASSCKGVSALRVRHYSDVGEPFIIHQSKFQWMKFKDMVHFYAMLGLIPVVGFLLYVNIFIGPATLKPIPEDYEPKHWEYYSHPLTRFLARYLMNRQKDYEKQCFVLYYNREDTYARQALKKAKRLIRERLDYQAWFYLPSLSKYGKIIQKDMEDMDKWAIKHHVFSPKE